ncbi:DDE endonuclease [Kitasatospora sp. NPDC059817]|uniref:DDE endonuclease n=1 Tax=unclassified Kitasatospora TaxID=2633591 RepID=UPI00364E958B
MGRTPVVHVRSRGSGRVSIAGMACYKKGERSRLIYGLRVHQGRKGEPKAFTWRNYRDLIVRARTQRGGPIALAWDNLSAHLMPQMKEFIAANSEWLTVFQLSSHAPDLTPRRGSGR